VEVPGGMPQDVATVSEPKPMWNGLVPAQIHPKRGAATRAWPAGCPSWWGCKVKLQAPIPDQPGGSPPARCEPPGRALEVGTVISKERTRRGVRGTFS